MSLITPSQTGSDVSRWFPAFEARQDASLRLICFPYAGAGTTVFRTWPKALSSNIEVRVAQLPGRGSRLRESRFEHMPPLIDALVEALGPLLDRPFALFGHSFGAMLAFEVARKLRGQGLVPEHLFVSGHVAPHLPNPSLAIHQLSDDAFLREVQSLNGMPPAVLGSRELLEIVLPIVRSDFTVLETYSYEDQQPLACPITSFGGLQDPRTSTSGLQEWRVHTSGIFDLIMLQGDHFFVDTARPLLLHALARRLYGNNGSLPIPGTSP